MSSSIDNIMSFSCDFDKKRNRWWCTNQSTDETFYVSGRLIPDGWDCYNVMQKIIDEQFPSVYPNYKFYGIQTNSNGQIYIRETQSYYPDYRFTILVRYKDIDNPTNPDDKPVDKLDDEELCKPIIFPKKMDKSKDEQDDEIQIVDIGSDDSDDDKPVLFSVKNKYEHCLSFNCDYDAINKRWWFINQDTDETYYFSEEDTDKQSGNFDKILCFIKNKLKNKYPFRDFDTPFLHQNGQIYDRETDTYYPPYAYTITIYYK